MLRAAEGKPYGHLLRDIPTDVEGMRVRLEAVRAYGTEAFHDLFDMVLNVRKDCDLALRIVSALDSMSLFDQEALERIRGFIEKFRFRLIQSRSRLIPASRARLKVEVGSISDYEQLFNMMCAYALDPLLQANAIIVLERLLRLPKVVVRRVVFDIHHRIQLWSGKTGVQFLQQFRDFIIGKVDDSEWRRKIRLELNSQSSSGQFSLKKGVAIELLESGGDVSDISEEGSAATGALPPFLPMGGENGVVELGSEDFVSDDSTSPD